MPEPALDDIVEFRRNRQQLVAVNNQRLQLAAQAAALDAALAELKDSKQKEVYKAVGNILIKKDAAAVRKETEDAKKKLDTRIAVLEKQEKALLAKLNKLKAKIEGAEKNAQAKP